MEAFIAKVRELARERGSSEAFKALIAENDDLIRSGGLDQGREIVSKRTCIYTELVRIWAEEQCQAFDYQQPFAVVALGGTGRGEMTPFSDNDFAFLFEDSVEGNEFLIELQKQVLHTRAFESKYGFECEALPFSLEDVPDLEGKQLNSFIDMKPVYDPTGLTDKFRERIRETYDSFEHFLYLRGIWADEWQRGAESAEDLSHFDIKNDGLRIFLAGIWILAGKQFCHSHEIYDGLMDPRDLEAYEFLLRLRAFIHSRRHPSLRYGLTGSHPEDVMEFEDFVTLGEMAGPDADEGARFEMGNQVRARLLAARRRIAIFTKSVIRRELRAGREASRNRAIVYGLGGLRIESPHTILGGEEKSRSAWMLLLASQHYGVPVDAMAFQDTFHNAGDWLEPMPELSSLFYEPNGSLADTFRFLSQLDGVEESLFPGYAKFETSLDRRVMKEKQSLRGKLQRQKIRAFEQFIREGEEKLEQAISRETHGPFEAGFDVRVEAALLDADHRAAVKLALKTKRLPITEVERSAWDDESDIMDQRYGSGLSGIPLEHYFDRLKQEAGFSDTCIDIAMFLITHWRAFKERSRASLNDDQQARDFAAMVGDEQRLRALFVFTYTDRIDWGSEERFPDRWFNIKELYGKSLEVFKPSGDPTRELMASGYSVDELAVLKDFGEDFFKGRYRSYANKFGPHLLRLAEDTDALAPKAAMIRSGASHILGLAGRDYRGLAATISAELYHHQVGLRQAHLFSSVNHGLAMDFFHLDPGDKRLPPDLTMQVEQAILDKRHIDAADEASLPTLDGTYQYHEWRPDQFCLVYESASDVEGVIYALCLKLYLHLQANIFGLTAHASSARAYISIYHNLPDEMAADDARQILRQAGLGS